MTINWERYRQPDGSLDLVAAYRDEVRRRDNRAEDFLLDLMDLQDIRSQRAASLAVTFALSNYGEL